MKNINQRGRSFARRFASNPIVRPGDVRPSRPGLKVQCVLNPGAFRFRDRTGLLLRVCERPEQERGYVCTPVLDPEAPTGVRVLRIRKSDGRLQAIDSRVFMYRGTTHLTTLSHLRLAWSDDGEHFTVEPKPAIEGDGRQEEFGVEDCRVVQIGKRFYLTYSAVASLGYGVGLISTADWNTFQRHGLIFPTPNKDCAILPGKVGGYFYALHRPSSPGFGGHFMWMARSPDLLHWGDHRCIAVPRPGMWDSARIGAGAAPILTEAGWLEIYHGATEKDRYCQGLMLLDRDNPFRVIARSIDPILEPEASYEREGFFGNVVFTNGHVVEGDLVTVYYGAADSVVCGARFSLRKLLNSLNV
jgi:beta-1,2-mannobiose phosphorylase / 1,2-beta-oligomannan phosphorylase